ncbi:signal peptidase I [Salininema proteolyticum]|uniref:Signal peptidase I n=1 Tax=Salininema proteolyticum TaxID=1607685 RepID=A0ABV8TZ12_9ACTN
MGTRKRLRKPPPAEGGGLSRTGGPEGGQAGDSTVMIPRLRMRKPRRPVTDSRLAHGNRRHYLSLWIELPLLLVVAFCAAVLLRTFVVQPFFIPSGSMERTLEEGDRVIVLKLTAELREPQRGEVVVFRGTDKWAPETRVDENGGVPGTVLRTLSDLVGLGQPDEKDFIKRVIATEGDTVACCDGDGNVTVNGSPLDESEYLYENAPLDLPPGTCHSRVFDEVTVPENHVFVMGDHRGDSRDSRCQGPVPVENILGRAVYLAWPTSRAGPLEIPEAFSELD